METPFLIIGAGVSGATLARVLADAGQHVMVIDERDHVGGNCHTAIDPATGIMVHAYGPHIFHTDQEHVWDFVSRFANFIPYRHRVLAVANGQAYRLPINLHTLSQFFSRCFKPEEAKKFLSAHAEEIPHPVTFEEQALSTIGRPLYEAFFKGYTIKQWGRDPSELPASILKRLPVRFSFDDNYFHHQRQALPEKGYTQMVLNMLAHENIVTRLGCRFEEMPEIDVQHTFYSGPIDRYFQYKAGRLAYRTLHFEELRERGDIQGTPVINFCDLEVPHTRITEHRHLSSWQQETSGSIAFVETSREAGENDIPYYPVHLASDKKQLTQYKKMASQTRDVTFLGRLGTYSYLDMDQAIAQALKIAEKTLNDMQNAGLRKANCA